MVKQIHDNAIRCRCMVAINGERLAFGMTKLSRDFIPKSYMGGIIKLISKLFMASLVMLLFAQAALGAVFRKKYSVTSPNQYLMVEILDDDLVHFEVSQEGSGPSTSDPLYTSPMVYKTNYSGPSSIVDNGNILETTDIKLEINATTLCVKAWDKTNNDAFLTEICPADMDQAWKGFNIDPGNISQVYELGQQL